MSKKHFIALADAIREHNARALRIHGVNADRMMFSPEAIDTLADFCRQQNYDFKRDRWLDYIAGKCGKNGGKV
jgi:hypothetical protein